MTGLGLSFEVGTHVVVKTSTLICILKLMRSSKENFSAGQFRRHQFKECSVNASWVSYFLNEYTLGWWWWHSAHSEWGPARWRKPHVGAIEGMSSNFYALNHDTIKLDPIIAFGKPHHWLTLVSSTSWSFKIISIILLLSTDYIIISLL